ncbi:MAG: 16S rRNA (guanine(966)-N(2))-methyltransferase RsmD [Bdellovibrionaceae bacterium]|nr:16S rRNA (guanine(966)-N(2))-methyltransferase RsmD [Pseudobdellovibrionaceae bacterium]
MRIISGILKGRRLVAFSAQHIRPTTDRVKETIFNKLQGDISGSRVLDLFSGTGNLAIESYSRGANYTEAVEMHPQSVKIIKQNLDNLKITDKIQLVVMDVLKYLQRYQGESFDIILVDPPFTKVLSHSVLEILGDSRAVKPGTIVVIESAKAERVDNNYSGLIFLEQKSFGDKKVTFWQGDEVKNK